MENHKIPVDRVKKLVEALRKEILRNESIIEAFKIENELLRNSLSELSGEKWEEDELPKICDSERKIVEKFHEFQEEFERLHEWDKKAFSAIYELDKEIALLCFKDYLEKL